MWEIKRNQHTFDKLLTAMPRATAISAGEATLLRKAIEDRFLRECPHVQKLKKNSYKESYRDLSQHMASSVPSKKNEFSITRLRKLFYYSDPNKSNVEVLPSFGELFLEGCYEYISEGEQTRESFLTVHLESESQQPGQGELVKSAGVKPSGFAKVRKRFRYWLSLTFLLGFLLGGIIGFASGQETRFLVWLFDRKHIWWICEFEDGTLVYNNFRSYRSNKEVMAYFLGETPGDCRSFTWKKTSAGKVKRHAMCFDESNAKKNLAKHGGIVKVYQER